MKTTDARLVATSSSTDQRKGALAAGGDDWHPSVGDCVRVILEEEWAHLRHIARDLALLR